MELLGKIVSSASLFAVPARDAVRMLLTFGDRVPIENRVVSLAAFDKEVFDLLPASVRLTGEPAGRPDHDDLRQPPGQAQPGGADETRSTRVTECWSAARLQHSSTPAFRSLVTHHSVTPFSLHSASSSLFQRVEVLLDLRDAQNFFNRGLRRPDLIPAVDAQRAHAELDGLLGKGRCRRAVQDQRTQRLVQNQQLIDAHAPLGTQLPALLAPGAVRSEERRVGK